MNFRALSGEHEGRRRVLTALQLSMARIPVVPYCRRHNPYVDLSKKEKLYTGAMLKQEL